MATLSKNMLREYWSRQQVGTNMKLGFDYGVLLQCDFRLVVTRGTTEVMTSDTWVIDGAALAPAALGWTYDAETFGTPLPQVSNQACSLTFFAKGQNPLAGDDDSVGTLLQQLYAAQFDPNTGLLALPQASTRLTFTFSLLGTRPSAVASLKNDIAEAKEDGNNELIKQLKDLKKVARKLDTIEDDQLKPFPLFDLADVKLGSPEVALDPKSLNPMGVKVNFVYRNSRWRNFADTDNSSTPRLFAAQTNDDALQSSGDRGGK